MNKEKDTSNGSNIKDMTALIIASIAFLLLSIVGCIYIIMNIHLWMGIIILVLNIAMTIAYIWFCSKPSESIRKFKKSRLGTFFSFGASIIVSGAVYSMFELTENYVFLQLMIIMTLLPILWFFSGVFIYQDEDIKENH